MKAIVNILVSIVDFFSAVINFVITLINDIIFVVQLIGKTIIKIPRLIGFLPSTLVAIIVVAMSVVIVYKVIGRD